MKAPSGAFIMKLYGQVVGVQIFLHLAKPKKTKDYD